MGGRFPNGALRLHAIPDMEMHLNKRTYAIYD